MNDHDQRSKEREQETIRIIEKYFQGVFTSLAPIHKLDGVLHCPGRSAGVRAYIELKRRNINASSFPSLMIAFSKCLAAQQIKDTMPDMPVCFIWHCNDSILGWMYNPAQVPMPQMGGREDRDGNQGADMEPVVYIDKQHMFEVPNG